MQTENRKIERLIQLLQANATIFVSGEKLAESLRVCRRTVCNWIHRLQAEGLEVEIKPRSGYRLIQVPDLLLPHLIKAELRTRVLGRVLHHFFRVTSTNDVAQELAQRGGAEGAIVIAEEQSQGRGRLGRLWFSEKGVGIYLSLILRPPLKPRQAPILNLAAAVAVSQAIEGACSLPTDIKWPNDVLIGGRKCCGILTEMSADIDRIKFIIVGVGINVNHKSFPRSLEGYASSLRLEGGRRYSRIEIVLSLLNNLERLYLDLLARGSDIVLDQWTQRSSYARGKEVSVDLGDRQIHGTTAGLSKEGALRIRLSNGQTEEVLSGDVVVWGMNVASDKRESYEQGQQCS